MTQTTFDVYPDFKRSTCTWCGVYIHKIDDRPTTGDRLTTLVRRRPKQSISRDCHRKNTLAI